MLSFARRSTFRFVPDKSPGRRRSGRQRSGLAGIIGQDILAALNGKGYRFFPNRANGSSGRLPYRADGKRECHHAG